MTRALLLDLAMLFSLESCDGDLAGDEDEAARLSDDARQLFDRAEALKPRAVPSTTPPRAA